MPTFTLAEAFKLASQRHQAGRLAEAEAIYRQILAVEPNHADALHYLGVIAHQAGRHDLALKLIGQALALDPKNASAHSNLGEAYRLSEQPEEAIASYRRALALKPDYAEAQNNLGNVLWEQGDIDEAIIAYRRALQLNANLPDVHNHLGLAFRQRGQLPEAMAAYHRALQLAPDRADVRSNFLLTLQLHPEQDNRSIATEQSRWNRQVSGPLRASFRPHTNDRNPERRLRIGYVSPDFRDHVVGRNLVPLFRCHAREEFEILCYAGVVRPDSMSEFFRQHASHWRSTVGIADEALAAMIRADGVDILVDLTQHSTNNRLAVFARRPAPVQASFAGYPASTGLEAIGYRISDRWLEAGGAEIETQTGRERPPGVPHLPQAPHATERSASVPYPGEDIHAATAEQLCLIESFWCYDPCGIEVAVNALPAQEKGWVTFGSLNNFSKVNDPLLKLWARVLAQVPASRLVLLSALGSHRQRTVEILEQDGITASRIDFIAPCPRRAYLELYHQVDIVLDPHPYNGHTTSLDALWMGVPFVSLAGERSVSRAGLSMLSNLGLPELVAHSEEEYVRIAVQLAGDLARLAELRATLRARMEASVLMDAPRFTRSIEAAFRTMWRQWCQEGPTR